MHASRTFSAHRLQVGGIGLILLSLWVAVLAYREKRRWLLTWAGVYFTVAITMTTLTYSKGPDPHDMFGCRWTPLQPPLHHMQRSERCGSSSPVGYTRRMSTFGMLHEHGA